MSLSYGVIMVIFLGALVPAVANRNFQNQSKERRVYTLINTKSEMYFDAAPCTVFCCSVKFDKSLYPVVCSSILSSGGSTVLGRGGEEALL